MRWLSESVEKLIAEELVESGQPKVHPWVVVGSGYGGAVAALRLAEKLKKKGQKNQVLVLERGEEYLPGDFPNDIANLPAHLRLERWNQKETEGDESGLFDLRIGENVGVLVGSALGGTSQINANVLIDPDPRVYKGWPAKPTEVHFKRARDTLEAAKFDKNCAKYRALKDLGRILYEASEEGPPCLKGCSVEFKPAEIAVNLARRGEDADGCLPRRPCNGCGDCVTGCNYFAKNTLTTNYLPQAKEMGARMFTGVTVLDVAPVRGESGPPWELRFVRTSERGSLRRYREHRPELAYSLRAERVILAAGTLGSTEILVRSRNVNGLKLSAKLGHQFSGNGDYLAFGYLQEKVVQGVGWGARRDAYDGPWVGPTITGLIKIRNDKDLQQCAVIEEGSVPGALARIFHEMVTTMAAVSQLTKESYIGESSENPPIDPLVLQPEALTYTQTLLAMGHDSAGGILCYDNREGRDRLGISWPELEKEGVYKLHDERLRYVEDLKAIYLQNPAWRPLPDSVRKSLSGPVLGNNMFTVHPLGGCPMGDSIRTGVVNHKGEVYKESGGTHQGLYVLDGSIIPCSLGVNPLLTITALAERAMEEILGKVPAAGKPALPPFPKGERDPYKNRSGDRVALQFTEILRGSVTVSGESKPRNASLILHMPVADLQCFFENPSHTIGILGPRGNDMEDLPARLRVEGPKGPRSKLEEYDVASGTVEIFERHAPKHRWSAILRVILTWYIERGHDELCRVVRRALGLAPRSADESKVSLFTMVCDWWRLVRHATERRIFTYRINLQRDGCSYHLHGVKRFEYAASWAALLSYVRSPDATLPLQRTNLWTSLGLLDITLYDERREIKARGSLKMDLVDMTHRHAAQLEGKRDSATAVLALAGYPLMFLRSMIKTRLWDFRLPDYLEWPPEPNPPGTCELDPQVPQQPNDATPWPEFPPLRANQNHGKVYPEDPEEMRVQRSRLDPRMNVVVRLTRYAQGKLECEPIGGAADLFQVKAIMLMNGFAHPSLPFVAQEIPQNLAEYFYDLGWDVWLFDYRTSTILDSSKDPCTMDDIAQFDIPAAVEKITEKLAPGLKREATELRIYAFAHCVGAASMAMSMLGGHLKRDKGGTAIAGVILSQMLPFLIGSETAQIRIPVGSLLRDVAGVDVVHLAATEMRPTAFESLLDRVGATLPFRDEERCPHENDRVVDRPDIATCKRLSGVISRLFTHERLLAKTHELLDFHFGRANTTLLVHGTKCLEYEQLVNADGQNVYVTDANIQRYFKLPIALLHGTENALFNIESCRRTYTELARINGIAFARKYYSKIQPKGYAHFDCIVGKDVDKNIQPSLGKFLEEAWEQNKEGIGVGVPGWGEQDYPDEKLATYVLAPVTGPTLGWVRREGDKCKARLWIQVDEYGGSPAWCAMTVRRKHKSNDGVVETWPIVRIPLEELAGAPKSAPIPAGVGYVAVAIADLELDLDPETGAPKYGYDIDMVSLHASPRDVVKANPGSDTPAPAAHHRTRPKRRGVMTPEQINDKNPVALDAPDEETALLEAAGAGERASTSNWIPRMRALVSEQARSRPTKRVPSLEDAKTMLKTLKRRVEETRETALRPNPRTLSRKRRRLPRDDIWTAHIRPPTLVGPRPDGTLRFLAGCCRYPGMAFESKRADATFKYINELLSRDEAHRDFMFMLGDQIYADATAGVFDPRSPVEKFRVRYERAFSSPEFRRLVRQLPTYMVIDDHEISNDWSQDEFAKGLEEKRLFCTAVSSFAAYQWAHSPRNISVPGFNYRFDAGGYRFLVLDTRTQRKRHDPVILEAGQFALLDQWLKEASGTPNPKFIVTGSVLAPGLQQADPKLPDPAVDSWQMAQEQRREVLGLLKKYSTQNVVFLSGDYHCAATAKLKFDSGLKAYAIVAPPFYAPYTYANVQEDRVKHSEDIDLGGGSVTVTAKVTGGSGFSDIRVDRLAGGKWSLEISTYALRFEDETPRFMPHTRKLDLG